MHAHLSQTKTTKIINKDSFLQNIILSPSHNIVFLALFPSTFEPMMINIDKHINELYFRTDAITNYYY